MCDRSPAVSRSRGQHRRAPRPRRRRPRTSRWWRDAVVYQVYVRSFADANGDGTGDLAGVRDRLPYLRDLGVDALWFNPWYPSPLADTGYDVADYRSIDPAFGTLEEAEQLIAEARALGIRTIVDIVPNHVSDQHPWFRAALAVAARLARAGALLVPARRRARTASCRRTAGSRSSAAPPGRGRRTRRTPASGTCTSSRPSSPTSTGRTPTCGASTRTCCASGSTAASPACASTRPRCSSRTRSSPRSRADARRASTRSPTGTSCTTSTAAGARSPTATPSRACSSARSGCPTPERFARYLRPDELHTAFNFDFLACPWEPRRDARVDRRRARGARAGRRAGDLGALEPRRHAAGHALRPRRHLVRVRVEARRARRPTSQRGTRRARAAALLAMALPGLDVRLPGRGARPAGGRGHPGRAPPGSDVAPLGRRRSGPRRLPRADSRGRATGRRTASAATAPPALARPARRLGAAHGRGAVGGRRPRCSRSTAPACACAAPAPWGERRRPALAPGSPTRSSRSRAASASSASSTSARSRSSCRPAPSVLIASNELEGGALPQDTTVWLRQANGPDRRARTVTHGFAPCSTGARKGRTMKSTRMATMAAVAVASLLAVRRALERDRQRGAPTKPVTISVASLIPGSTHGGDPAVQRTRSRSSRRRTRSIKVKSVEYQWTGPTFAAKLAAGTLPTVFEVPFTDARTLGDNGQLADLTAEVKALPYFSEVQPGGHRRGHDVEGQDRRAAEGGVRAGAALQPQALHPGRARPEQAADDLGAAAGRRQADRAEDRQGRLRRDGQGRQHRRLDPDDARLLARRADGDRHAARSATATLNNPQTVTALNMLKQMRWTDNSMGSNFDYGWSDINQAFAAGNVGMYISGSDVYTNLVQASNIDPSIYGLATIPLAKNKNGRRPRRRHARRRPAGRERGRAGRGGEVDRLLLRAAAGQQGAGDPQREDAGREQAAGRRSRAADLQQGAVRPGEHVDQAVHQRAARPDEAVHRPASSTRS